MKCSFALLSGGSSRRFVSDKTKALLYGKPLFLYGLECGLEVSDDVLHISKNKDKYKPFINNVKYLEDELDVICPMSGLITAARHAKYEYIFILSADSPLITGNFFKYLYNNIKSYDGVMPVINSKSYPLTAVYKKSILLSMEEDYKKENFKLIKSLERHNIIYLQEDEIIKAGFKKDIFININFQNDLKSLEEKHG